MPKLFKPNSTHMLYKVTDPSRGTVSYIFGSLNKVSPQVQQDLVDKILATGVLDNCDKFVTEILPPSVQGNYQFNPHSVADGLMSLAMSKDLEPEPLDTRSYAVRQAVKAEVRDLLRPLPVIKWGFLLATFPGPLALYLLGRHVQRQHQHKKLLEHYRQESIDRELKKLGSKPGTYGQSQCQMDD